MIKSVFRGRPGSLLAGLAAGLTLAFSVGATASAAPPESPGTGHAGVLRGVSALSPHQAWAVGYTCTSHCGFGVPELDRTLILHWNGTAWSRMTSPDPNHNGRLNAVTALSPSSVWAAGSYCAAHCGTSSAVFRALILHGDGATWTRVASPGPAGAVITTLNAVSASSAHSVWAVGTSCSVNCNEVKGTPRPQTFILRWNGAAWQQVASPNPGGRYGSSLLAVSALAPGNAWATGNYGTEDSFQNFTPGRSLVLHWNGSKWAQQPSPSFGQPAPGSVLYGVSALSASDALAAGSIYNGNCECARTLGLAWHGQLWARVKSPSPGPPSDPVAEFFGVSAASPADAWAAGYWESSAAANSLTLIAHWNGKLWAKVPSPNASAGLAGDGNFLNAVSAASASDAWAAGYYVTSDGSSRTLVLHWNGTAWARS